MKIKESEFELYEECIHTGQVDQRDVPKLLAENPDFADWYSNRVVGQGSITAGIGND